MKLAFTTLGCPTWDLDKIIANAIENGYDGIDFRGYLGELDIYKLPEFSTEVEETVKRFRDASLEIPCFSSSARIFTTSEDETKKYIEELTEYAKLCNIFNSPYIRVFGGQIGDISREEAIEIAVKNAKEYIRIVEPFNVKLLLETHDDWTECEYVKTVLNKVNSDSLQVLWDIHHPYRTVGEDINKTWETLGEWVKYTHWKDSYIKEDTVRGYQLCLLGEGDIPLPEIMNLLKTNGYDGYYTLEWEKKWCPEIEEPEVAFKKYVEFMRETSKI